MATAVGSEPSAPTATPESARSPQPNPFWPLQKLQDFMQTFQSQYKVKVEDAFVKQVKEKLMIIREHPNEACGVAVAAGFLLMRGPRRILLRNTIGLFQTEKSQVAKAELNLKELGESVEQLKKESKNMLARAEFGEERFQRGKTKLRDAGYEIRRLAKSIYKIESNAADLMDGLRALSGSNALKLRAEVASMAADLKQERGRLNKRIMNISDYGIRV